jgi:acetate kinase
VLPRAGRSVPARRALEAGALPREVQGLRLSVSTPGRAAGGCLLTLNAGSSSLKFALFDADATDAAPLASGQVDAIGPGLDARLRFEVGGGDDGAARGRGARGSMLEALGTVTHVEALQAAFERLRSATDGAEAPLAGIGHRVVHGGVAFDRPVRIDAAVVERLAELESLAPLHQPHNVAGVRAALQAFPGVPQVACFDTAFHRTQPEVHQRFALPDAWHARGVRRYGFHGLSYESICTQLAAEPDGNGLRGRLVIAHLGNGASLCAVRDGAPIATTMSFSPLDGLTMGTRCGRIDGAAVLHLLRAHGLTVAAVETLLARESGLLGLSGVSSDMRALEASPEPAARLAIDHFVEQLLQGIAAMAAALRGLDTLVFTAGIGENAAALRARVADALAWTGMVLDPAANAEHAPCISTPASRVGVRVVHTDEEGVIARHTARVLGLLATA